MEKVSAIITTYKRDRGTLLRAYNSIVNQSYDNIEIIIIDDNGEGTSYQKENEKYCNNKNVLYVPLKKNSGAQVARNKGIEIATGNYIAFLDDDDEWNYNKISEQMHVFQKSDDSNLGLVYCWYKRVKTKNSFVKEETITLPEYSEELVKSKLLQSNFIGSTSFPLLRKSVFSNSGTFDESLEASQDYDMWIRIVEHYSIKCVNEVLVKYHIHDDKRITKNNSKKARAEIAFLVKHFEAISQDNKALGDKLTKISIYLMRSGKKKEARKYLSYAFKYTPFNIRIIKYYLETLT